MRYIDILVHDRHDHGLRFSKTVGTTIDNRHARANGREPRSRWIYRIIYTVAQLGGCQKVFGTAKLKFSTPCFFT